MKKWNNAEFVTVEIAETAYGRNMHAKEANANKNPNNGAGGRQDDPIDPTVPIVPSNPDDGNKSDRTTDSLS